MTYEYAIEEFENIKDQDIKTTKRLEEIANIFSCVYRKNKVLANEMWQYLIDRYNDANGKKFYVIRLFKALTFNEEKKWDFLIMNKNRINIMFEYAHASTNKSLRAFNIIKAYLKYDKIDEAVEVINILKHYEKRLSMVDGAKIIVVHLMDDLAEKENVVELKRKTMDFFEKCVNAYQSENFYHIFQIELYLDKGIDSAKNLKYCLDWMLDNNVCDAEYYNAFYITNFSDLLYMNRSVLAEQEIVEYIEKFFNKYTGKYLRFRSDEGDACNWLLQITEKSIDLSEKIISNDVTFGNQYIQNLISKEKWDDLIDILTFIMENDLYVCDYLEMTIEYYKNVKSEGIPMSFDVPLPDNTLLKVNVKLPKIIFHDSGCYDIEDKSLISFCNAVIESCNNVSNLSEDGRIILDNALNLKKMIQ